MNYTQGPWSVQIKPKDVGGMIGTIQYLSIDNETGPVFVLDMHDKVIAAIVHRPGRGQGFSETASNARLIGHCPELYEKAVKLVQFLSTTEGEYTELLEDLEKTLDAIAGQPVVSSDR